ncbi:MAG TPA: phosphoribosylformylglycinamidine synthase subunit PurS [Synergistales bacterium]|nr:phosphoribosylformylglycinamidine synthase subunit PurS [Synergistales bacterium]
MNSFHVKILVYLKEGVLDTQGKAVAKSLIDSGYSNLMNVRVGKYIQLWINAISSEDALKEAEKMCDDLLVNQLIEQYEIEIES